MILTNGVDPKQYVDGVLQGQRRSIAKAITLVESSLPEHRKLAATMMEGLLPFTGKSVRLGITGVPGVGKSTFVENLGILLVEDGFKVAVLAVDPSSSRSGGSILGDKTRMERLAAHPSTFIRPSPSGETLGGVAAKTRETLLVCEAAGYDVVLVETVGVGQSETSVATMVDFFLALMITGAGDELQGIKKGVLEVADAIAINKCDGDNIDRAEKARLEFEIAMHIVTPESSSWRPPVCTCSSILENGTRNVWDTVLEHKKIMTGTGEFALRRKRQSLSWMWALVEEGLKARFRQNSRISKRIPEISGSVEQELISPSAAADELLSYL